MNRMFRPSSSVSKSESKFLRLSLAIVVCAVLLAGARPATAQQAERADNEGSLSFFRFAEIGEVVSEWNPKQHLYVRGDLGIELAKLMELERWLHDKGANWTVILFENAQDQRYVNEDGRVEKGMDAVELALTDLMKVGSFRNQRFPDAIEPAGAVFILFLEERKFSYGASEAQNRRKLGKDYWTGKLDRPAFRAMRGGGRIEDAVRDTVQSISNSLQRKIAEEQKLAAERVRQLQRSEDEVKSRLRQLEEKLITIEGNATSVRSSKPNATADLAQPNVGELRNELKRLEQNIAAEEPDIGTLQEDSAELSDLADNWLNRYNEYSRFDESVMQLEQRLKEVRTDAGDLVSSINPTLGDVESLLKEARENHSIADSEFQKNLNAATHALENSTETLVAERADRARKQARRSFIRWTIGIANAIVALILGGLFLWLNRRRAPAKQRALQRLDERREEVKQEIEGVSDLLKRSDVVIGDREAIARKGYTGKTKELSERAISDVDDLLVMSGSVEKVMDKASDRIKPRSWWRKLSNWWSAENYNEGFDLLENKPIEFSEGDGISLVGEEAELATVVGETTADEKSDSPDAKGESNNKLALSFADLFKVFRSRATRVSTTIDQVEAGWTQIVSTNADLQRAIDEAGEAEQKAREATEQDELLSVPQLFDDLLKSAQSDQDNAEEMGKNDPVSAIEGPATNGLRKAANAKDLSLALIDVREKFMVTVREKTKALKDRDRQTEWTDAALEDFTVRAQTLATDALNADVSAEIAEWRTSFERFSGAVNRAVELHDQSTGEVANALEETQRAIDSARHRIASKLNMSHDEILTESDHHADEMLAEAIRHNLAAQTALDRGDPPTAELQVAEASQWSADTNAVIDQSLHVLDHLPQELDSLAHRKSTLGSRLNESEQLLDSLRAQYTDSALMVEGAATDGEQVDATVAAYNSARPISTTELLELARRQQDRSSEFAERAKVMYDEGKLLTANNQFRTATEHVESGESNLQLMNAHADKLASLIQEVEQHVSRLGERSEQLESRLGEHHVTTATQASAEKLRHELSQLKFASLSGNVRRDPVSESDAVNETDTEIETLFEQLEVDRRSFNEATQSVDALKRLLDQGSSVARQTRSDQIPDSVTAKQEMQSMSSAYQQCEQLAQRLKTPHSDWLEIDRDADRILGEASTSLNTLRSELNRAERAAAAIQDASSAYQQAVNWSGGYGIRANPHSSRSSIEKARSALAQGDYDRAIAVAGQSISAVQNAIAIAENEVNRRSAAERRERESRRRSRMPNIGGVIGGGSSRRSTGSSSSRPTRSSNSSKSSGSSSSGSSSSGGRGGFSRSGW